MQHISITLDQDQMSSMSPLCIFNDSVWPHMMTSEQQNSLHLLYSMFLNERITHPPLQTTALKLLKCFEKYIWKGSSALSELAAGQCLNKWIQLANPCLKDQSLHLCKEYLWRDRCQQPICWCILEFVGMGEGRAVSDSRASLEFGSHCLKNPDRKDQDPWLHYWLTEIIYPSTQKMAKAH